MGKFLLGIFATLVGGLLLAILTPSAQAWWTQNDSQVGLTSLGALYVGTSIRQSLEKNSGSDVFQSLIIENTGNQDLDDFSVTLISKDSAAIKDAGEAIGIGTAENPRMDLKDGRLHLGFKLLKKGDTAAVWIRTDTPSPPLIRADKKGVTIRPSDASEDSYPWALFIGVLIALLLGVAIGAWGQERAQSAMLKKIGFDPKEITEAYRKAFEPPKS